MKANRRTDETSHGASPRRSCEVERVRGGQGSTGGLASPGFQLDEFRFELLSLLHEERTIRFDLLAALLRVDPDELRPVVAELESAGLLAKKAFLRDEPAKYPWVWTTRDGTRAVDVASYYYYEPTEGVLRHTAGVLKIRLFWARERPGALWVPERELGRRNNRTKRHLADGAVEVDGAVIPIEYELTSKDRLKLLHGMCELVRRHGVAHYHCSETTRSAVTAVRDTNHLDQVHIFDVPEFPGIA